MVRPARRRKVKNPSSKVSRRVANRHFKRQPSLIHAPKIVSENWDKNLTLRQNYEKMGLISQLNDVAGGQNSNQVSEMTIEEEEEFVKEEYIKRMSEKIKDSFTSADPDAEIALAESYDFNALNIGARIGQKRIKKKNNETTEVVKKLEEQAAALANQPKKERHVSSNEELVIIDLIKKHGTDYKAMFKDLKLNKYQLTAKQLKKKCENYLKKQKELTSQQD